MVTNNLEIPWKSDETTVNREKVLYLILTTVDKNPNHIPHLVKKCKESEGLLVKLKGETEYKRE